MNAITGADIKVVVDSILNKSKEELMSKSKEQLEEYWFFNFETGLEDPIKYTYEFHQALELYGSFCREWEEEKNGSVCVVGRVRDNYLIPKIKKYLEQIQRLKESG